MRVNSQKLFDQITVTIDASNLSSGLFIDVAGHTSCAKRAADRACRQNTYICPVPISISFIRIARHMLYEGL